MGMVDLFEVLDRDCSGDIQKDEFIEGILSMAECGQASSETILILKVMRMVRSMEQLVGSHFRRTSQFQQRVTQVLMSAGTSTQQERQRVLLEHQSWGEQWSVTNDD